MYHNNTDNYRSVDHFGDSFGYRSEWKKVMDIRNSGLKVRIYEISPQNNSLMMMWISRLYRYLPTIQLFQ